MPASSPLHGLLSVREVHEKRVVSAGFSTAYLLALGVGEGLGEVLGVLGIGVPVTLVGPPGVVGLTIPEVGSPCGLLILGLLPLEPGEPPFPPAPGPLLVLPELGLVPAPCAMTVPTRAVLMVTAARRCLIDLFMSETLATLVLEAESFRYPLVIHILHSRRRYNQAVNNSRSKNQRGIEAVRNIERHQSQISWLLDQTHPSVGLIYGNRRHVS